MPGKTRIDEPAVECVNKPSRPRLDLPSSRAASSTPKRHHLKRRGEHELPRMQDERLTVRNLNDGGQIVLLQRRVDMGIQMVVEHPEPAVKPHVDTRRLDQIWLERIELKLARLELHARSRSDSSTQPGYSKCLNPFHRPYAPDPRFSPDPTWVILDVHRVPRFGRVVPACGCSSMAEHQLPKLTVRVRFSSPAPTRKAQVDGHASPLPGLRLSKVIRSCGPIRARYPPPNSPSPKLPLTHRHHRSGVCSPSSSFAPCPGPCRPSTDPWPSRSVDPCSPRSPDPARWSRAGKSSPPAHSRAPSGASTPGYSPPTQRPRCSPYGEDRGSGSQRADPPP